MDYSLAGLFTNKSQHISGYLRHYWDIVLYRAAARLLQSGTFVTLSQLPTPIVLSLFARIAVFTRNTFGGTLRIRQNAYLRHRLVVMVANTT